MNPENGFPFEWNYLIQHTRKWSEQARPQPKHLKWVPYYEPGKYDLAILHIDQQCLVTPFLGKSKLFREVKAQIKDIPIIVINHGTPVYPELFMQYAEMAGMEPSEKNGEEWARREMEKLLEGVAQVIVNSHEAQEQWNMGQAIIHGLDPDEWWDLRKEPRVITVISPAGIGQKYYGRMLLTETRDILKTKYGIELIWVGEDGGVQFAPNFSMYREYLGKSLVYFNPTIGSPMPRSRTEAMMSGCCVVTTRHQDADGFIKDGVNGFLVNDNPEECAKVVSDLIFDYSRAIKVGQEGRKTAIEIFNGKRFRQNWLDLIQKILGREIPLTYPLSTPDN